MTKRVNKSSGQRGTRFHLPGQPISLSTGLASLKTTHFGPRIWLNLLRCHCGLNLKMIFGQGRCVCAAMNERGSGSIRYFLS